MNGSGFFGRLASGPLAETLGVFNAMCFTAISSSALIFGLLGVKTVAGVVVFAVLFGFFLNACACLSCT
jgi:MCP family monocarboxylic acid transporter-like MFS transporter 10